MAAYVSNIVIDVGTDFTQTFYLENIANTPVNLTVHTATSKMKKHSSSSSTSAVFIVSFPNPTNGKFTLDLSENTTVKIYSVIGSLIYEQEVQKDQIIDLTNYKKGIYTIQVNTPKYIYSKKLIVE